MNRVGVILAGGASARMGNVDKATVILNGRRLIDIVCARFAPQVDRLLISGPGEYGLGLTAIRDIENGVKGPAAGVYAAGVWLRANQPGAIGFFTAPVDGPFLPDDLVERLGGAEGTAVAADDKNVHPTFAYWRMGDLAAGFSALAGAPSISLRALADACHARRVVWRDENCFFNINTEKDLTAARQIAGISG